MYTALTLLIAFTIKLEVLCSKLTHNMQLWTPNITPLLLIPAFLLEQEDILLELSPQFFAHFWAKGLDQGIYFFHEWWENECQSDILQAQHLPGHNFGGHSLLDQEDAAPVFLKEKALVISTY